MISRFHNDSVVLWWKSSASALTHYSSYHSVMILNRVPRMYLARELGHSNSFP